MHFSSSFPPSFSLILWYHLSQPPPSPPSPPCLLFPLIICALTQQQDNFVPGGAAEETEPFHVSWTAGLIRRKTDFFQARVKPICSCTKFLCTLSWLQTKKLSESGMVSLKTLVSHSAVPAACQGRSRGCAADSRSQAEGRSNPEMYWFMHGAASPQDIFTALPSFVPHPLLSTRIGIFVQLGVFLILAHWNWIHPILASHIHKVSEGSI